jgi:hypothetical protein
MAPPACCSTIRAAAALAMNTAPRTFTVCTRSKNAGSMSSTGDIG